MTEATGPRAADLTLEEKAALTSGADFWTTKAIDRVGVPSIMLTDGPHGLRKQAGGDDHLGLARERAGDVLPARSRPQRDLRSRARGTRRRGARRRVGHRGRRRHPRPRHQHQALAAVRPQLRVHVGGSDRLRRDGRGPRQGDPVEGRRRLAQALRREQPGDRPAARLERRRSAPAAGDLPARVPARRRRTPAVDRDVLVQPAQRRVHVGGSVAAHDRCCATSGASRASSSPTGAR